MKHKLVIFTAACVIVLGLVFVLWPCNMCLDKETAYMAEDSSKLRQIVLGMQAYKQETGEWPLGKSDLDRQYPMEFPDKLYVLRKGKNIVEEKTMVIWIVPKVQIDLTIPTPLLMTNPKILYKERYGLIALTDGTVKSIILNVSR